MPFGDYKDFADCVAKNSDKDNPKAYCASLHKKITGKWPSEGWVHPDFQKIYQQFLKHIKDEDEAHNRYVAWVKALNLDETQPYGLSMREQFKWVRRHADFDLWKEDRDAKYWRVEAGFPVTSMNENVYTENELLRSARTIKGQLVNLNHKYDLKEIDILAGEYEDGIVESVIRVPRNLRCPICTENKTINDLIESKGIVNVSLEASCAYTTSDYGKCEGMYFTGLSLLTKDTLPGIPLTRLMPLEHIMVEALQSSTNVLRRPKKVKKIMMEVLEQQPRTDAERAKAHFNISDEDWNKLSDEEKQAYIDKLPPRGSAEQKDDRPPKDWMDKCKSVVSSGMPGYSEDQVNATCGNIWHNIPKQHGIGDMYYSEKWLKEQITQVIPVEVPTVKSEEPDEHGQCRPGLIINALGKCVPMKECGENQHWDPNANEGQGGCVADTVPKPETPETAVGTTPAPTEDVLTDAPLEQPKPEEQPPLTGTDKIPKEPSTAGEQPAITGAPAEPEEPMKSTEPGEIEPKSPHDCPDGYHYEPGAVPPCVPDEPIVERVKRIKAELKAKNAEEQLVRWEFHYSKLDGEHQQLRGKYKEQYNTINALRNDLDGMRKELTIAQVDRDKFKRERDEAKGQRDDFAKRSERIQTALDKKTEQAGKTLDHATYVSQKNLKLNTEIMDLHTRIEQLEGQLKKAKSIAKKVVRIKI